jgi:prevent-host-death family protein
MTKRYSIAEARHNLAALVHELDKKARVELTRRGEPVAVLLSIREYRNLAAEKRGFWPAFESFRRAVDLSKLKIEPEIFTEARDRTAGREMRW